MGRLYVAARARAISGELLKSAAFPGAPVLGRHDPGGEMLTLQTRKTEAICDAKRSRWRAGCDLGDGDSFRRKELGEPISVDIPRRRAS